MTPERDFKAEASKIMCDTYDALEGSSANAVKLNDRIARLLRIEAACQSIAREINVYSHDAKDHAAQVRRIAEEARLALTPTTGGG